MTASVAQRASPAALEMPPVAEPPKQRRSQALLDRLIAASEALLAERDFEHITIADIAERAGVSVGVFYTRFATKEHLLAHLTRDLSARLQARVARALSPEKVAWMTMMEIAECYFTLAADAFVEHRAVIRPLSLVVRLEAHRELRDLVAAFNTGVHTLLRERLLAHRKHIRHDDPARAVDFAILAASAVLREVVLYGEPVSRLGAHQRRIVREAATLCVAYLTFPGAHPR